MMTNLKREHAILTYTNTFFYPLAPKIEDINICDIAHALSQMCRANGHFKTFYSVAQHSMNCSLEAKARGLSKRVQLACLLHDASEAYISDITRPVKAHLHEYRKIEAKLQQVIYKKFDIADLNAEEIKNIDEIDNALLYYEFKYLHHQGLQEQLLPLYSLPDVGEKNMSLVEKEFILLMEEVSK